MKYIKYFENFNNSTLIEFPIMDYDDNEIGNVSGIIHYTKEYLENWMYKENIEEKYKDIIRKEVKFPVAILYNINIQQDYRNKGFGNIGMQEFLEAASEANSILLIADIQEENDFSLIEWYEDFGFRIIGKSGELPIMILNENLNENYIQENLNEDKFKLIDHIRNNHYTYSFNVDNLEFMCYFKINNQGIWNRWYKSTKYGYRLISGRESHNKPFTIVSIVTDITLDFINRESPDILQISHLKETNEFTDGFINKRARLNYRFLKNKIDNNIYNIDYYYHNEDSLCIIYKKKYDLNKLGLSDEYKLSVEKLNYDIDYYLDKFIQGKFYKYKFKINDVEFICNFNNYSNNDIWEREYFTLQNKFKTLENLLEVKYAFKIAKTIAKITIHFLNTESPNYLMITHINKDKTLSPKDGYTTRAKLSKRYLESNLPQGYSIDYLYRDGYTVSFIYKSHMDYTKNFNTRGYIKLN